MTRIQRQQPQEAIENKEELLKILEQLKNWVEDDDTQVTYFQLETGYKKEIASGEKFVKLNIELFQK